MARRIRRRHASSSSSAEFDVVTLTIPDFLRDCEEVGVSAGISPEEGSIEPDRSFGAGLMSIASSMVGGTETAEFLVLGQGLRLRESEVGGAFELRCSATGILARLLANSEEVEEWECCDTLFLLDGLGERLLE